MSVKSVNQVKYLGLIFDSNLNWKPYLHELIKKVSRGIGVLSKIRYYVTTKYCINYIIQLFTSFSPMVYQSGAIPTVLLLNP